jgi:N-acetylglutamate synthase-like GNAT family acetyltransferase
MADLGFPDYIIRPAIAQDKWQIQRLLGYFGADDVPRPLWYLRSSARRLRYLVLFFLTALGINLIFLFGVRVLGVMAGLAILVLLFLLLNVVFSQEWKKFWIVEQKGRVVGCGKLCEYVTYSMVYNVLVLPEYRHQGMGSALVKQLIAHATKPLYLACFPNKIGFYTRLGFVQMRSSDLSPMLRQELGISSRTEIVPLVLR